MEERGGCAVTWRAAAVCMSWCAVASAGGKLGTNAERAKPSVPGLCYVCLSFCCLKPRLLRAASTCGFYTASSTCGVYIAPSSLFRSVFPSSRSEFRAVSERHLQFTVCCFK